MKQYQFSLKDECMKELPLMEEPEKKFIREAWDSVVVGLCICAYCGYRSSSSLEDMKHDCVVDKYFTHIKNLQSIPVPKQFLNQFENDKVYNEDDFETKQEQKLSYGATIKSGGFENGSQIYFEMVAIPKQKVDDTEVWDEVSDRICDILFESNGFSSGADMIINDLKKHFTITRK